MSKESHLERTAAEPRQTALHVVKVKRIDQINDSVRVVRLEISDSEGGIGFLPGQFLDVLCPGVDKAGGFTPTSPPSRAAARKRDAAAAAAAAGSARDDAPYVELAVQRAPGNPAAAFLWRGPPSSSSSSSESEGQDDEDEDDGCDEGRAAAAAGGHGRKKNDVSSSSIVGAELRVRVGGSFVFPPPGIPASPPQQLRRVVFVAGGMGVNPLVCMAAHLAEQQQREAARVEVRFLYSVRSPGGGAKQRRIEREEEAVPADRILFLERLAAIFVRERLKGKLSLFLTSGAGAGGQQQQQADDGGERHVDEPEEVTGMDSRGADGVISCNEVDVPFRRRRITRADLADAIGPDKRSAVVYVCGVPAMTDAFVKELTSPLDSGGLSMEAHRVLSEKWW